MNRYNKFLFTQHTFFHKGYRKCLLIQSVESLIKLLNKYEVIMKNLITIFIVILFLVFAGNSVAQDNKDLSSLSLDELLNIPISVSSTKAKDIFNTPSSVTVVDENMILKYRFNSVAEALSIVPGMQVLRTYLKRNLPTARGILQDHYANKVLVLINGVASWSTVTGEANIDKINIHDVERIEVLKGPASVLYGTNAYTGAINIVLKNPVKESVQTYFGTGSNGIFQAGGNYSYSDNDFKVFISGNASDEAGVVYKFTDEKKTSGHYKEYMRGQNFNLNASYKDHSLLFNTYVSHESYLGVDPNFTSGIGNDHWNNGYLAAYKFSNQLTEALDFNYSLTYDWNQRNLSRTADDNTRANIKGYRVYNNLKFNYNITQDFNIEAGADYDLRQANEYKNYNVQKDSTLTGNDMDSRKVYEYSLFAQAGLTVGSFNLLAGTRYSSNELFGSNLSSRTTLVYSIDGKNSVKFIWGQSYRAPSLFELYFRTSSNTVFGNTSLSPEKSNSLELAYLTSFDKFFIQALVYHATYENKIFRVRRFPTSTTDKSTIYVNGSTFKADGLELEARYQNEDLADLFANYSYTKGDNGDEINGDGKYNFKYVPQHVLAAGIYKQFENFAASFAINYISKTSGPLYELDSYLTADVSIGFKHKLEKYFLNHSFSVKNLFDKTVRFPEFSRGTINDIPSGYGQRFSYELQLIL